MRVGTDLVDCAHSLVAPTALHAHPQRIALISPEYPGCGPAYGIGRYVADQAAAFHAAGHNVVVLVASDHGGFRVDPVTQVVRRVAALPTSLFLRTMVAATWLVRELAAFAPTVIEASNWGALTAFVPDRWPVVIRLSTSAADAGGQQPDRLRGLRVALERRAVRRAQHVIADSTAMAIRGAALYGRMAASIIPHAWRGPLADQHSPRELAAVFVGRWEPRKGVDILIAAWSQVRQAMPAAYLHVVGDGQPAALSAPGIIAHGRLDDAALAALRRRCRIQVVPSRFESFGLVVLEAWAAGLLPVTTDAGALPEVVADAGLVVPVGDSAALADGLIRGLRDAHEPMIARGRMRLATDFSAAMNCQASLAIYAALRPRHD